MRVRVVPVLLCVFLNACGAMPSADGGVGGGEGSGGGSASGGGTGEGGGTATGGGFASGGGSASGGGTATGGGSATGGGAGDCAGTVFCEDFEGYGAAGIANGEVLGPWKASVAGDGGALFISTVHAKNGGKALRYTVPAGGPAHGTMNQKDAGGLVPGNDLFGRAWVYYAVDGDAGLPLGVRQDGGALSGVHSWLFQANGPVADGGNTSINLGGGGTKLQLNYHFPASSSEQSVQGGTVTTDAWHCVQWEYLATGPADGGENQARVWLDGAKVIDVATAKGWDMARPWNNFDLGFTHYQELGNAVDVYIDDFALGAHALACP